ncbi:cytochrome b-c1 complex subunit 6, mitochondrial [Trichomonascus vanleenenianus]|uniref:ubiquinol--cytochrome-c reductase subunit 6 n=1 Tax=Trichomonascus vanleenenianus TaxID=2268995 RepID=UPI003EC969E0
MGVTDLWNDLVESLMPTIALAEEEVEEETPAESEEEEEEDEEEEEEEEEEVEDVFPALREEAAEGVCHEFKHHFEACQQRVFKEMEEPDYADKDYKEDCVEEFFHLNHCIDEHVAPTFFSKLK